MSEPDKLAARFWSKVVRSDAGCWEWTGCRMPRGYGTFWTTNPARHALAHRISWELANGPIPKGMCICHRCDNPPCVRPDHLFLGTQAENMKDMNAKGRRRTTARYGEAHHMARLTEDAVRMIRERVSSGESQRSVARAFGIVPTNVGMIVNRKTWKRVA